MFRGRDSQANDGEGGKWGRERPHDCVPSPFSCSRNSGPQRNPHLLPPGNSRSCQFQVPIFLCSSPAVQGSIVGRLRGPRRCPHPNLQNSWMSPYNSKIDFVAAMIPMAVSWGDYPGFSRWVQCCHRGPHKRETGRSEGAMWSQKQRSERYGTRNQTMPWPLEAGKRQEMDSPFLLAEKAASPANSLIWVRGEWFWTSDFQYLEVINACCFKFVVICYSSCGRLIHQDKVNLISSEAWISFVDKDPLLNFVSVANL